MKDTYTPQAFVNAINELSDGTGVKIINFTTVNELKEFAIKFGYTYNETGNIFIKNKSK